MLIDSTPLHNIGDYTVLAERYAVTFRDDQTVGLHPVNQAGRTAMFLRCLIDDAQLHAIVFDLRDISHTLASAIQQAPARDASGLVLFSLRARFPTRAGFFSAVMGTAKAIKLLDAPPPVTFAHCAQVARADARAMA